MPIQGSKTRFPVSTVGFFADGQAEGIQGEGFFYVGFEATGEFLEPAQVLLGFAGGRRSS